MQTRPWSSARASCLGAVALVLGAGTGAAHAGGTLGPGTQHDPPRFIDESRTFVTVGGQDDGYVFQLETLLIGYTSKSDQLWLDWKQGGKLLARAKCTVESRFSATYAVVKCDQRERTVKAKGAVEAQLIYQDDADEKDYLVRTFKLTVREWAKGTWQIAPEDLLGAAYAIDRHHQSSAQDPHPRFRFWVAGGELGRVSATLRCRVDGKPLPELPAAVTSTTRIEAVVIPPKGERTAWRWSTFEVEASTVMDGPKGGDREGMTWLAEHPGAWDCFVRADGRNLRELLFQVTDQGAIESHPMQRAPGAAPLAPGVSLIDIRIPRDAAIDQRIKPDQLRMSRGFGLPWPGDPSVQAIHAAFPPAVEAAKPVAPRKAVGKIVAGTTHTPPRFVDETTTSIALRRVATGKIDGYGFTAFAVVAGATGASDRVRLDWKQSGKVLATTRCTMEVSRFATGLVTCEYADKPLTAKGAIDAELIYSDDSEGQDYLVRTYRVTVAKYPSFGDAVWQLVPDDVLAGAWVRHYYPFKLHDARAGRPHFFFWVAHDERVFGDVTTLRCTVDGNKHPDIKLDLEAADTLQLEAAPMVKGKAVKYRWLHVDGTADVQFGSKADYEGGDGSKARFLADHPGAWVCQLRSGGAAIRELRFTVNDKGFISSELQTAPGAAATLDNVAAIDLRFPRNATFDTRVRPAAMKKSRGFGLPWPEAPSVQAIQATFPPASGLPDPR